VILHCNFEELAAVNSGAIRTLASEDGAGVAAPPEALADVEALLTRLDSTLTLNVLFEQASVERALATILDELRDRMDRLVVEQHVGAEESIIAYFDYANVLTVFDRVQQMGKEMRGMIELMTGEHPNAHTARSITFPD
jgi:hypothetical protein